MNNTLQLVFRNTELSKVTISIPYCKTDLTAEEVRTAMDVIVAKDIFTSLGGNLVAAVSAKIVATTETDLF